MVIVSRDTALTIAQVEPYFRSKGYTFTVLLDPELSVSKNWGVKTAPVTYLISSDGTIIFQQFSFNCRSENPGQLQLQQEIHRCLLDEDLPEDEVIALDLPSPDEDGLSGMTEEEREDYERDAEYIWRKFVGKCKHRYIYEIDNDMARYDFAVVDEGMTDTKHGRQPYHTWQGLYEHLDHEFLVEVWLAHGRGDWHFYRVRVDGQEWGEY